jgi:hypothetical protein
VFPPLTLKPDLSIDDFDSKRAYKLLLKTQTKPAVIAKKFVTINFAESWTHVNNKLVSPRPRELCWKIIHNVLTVNAFMFHIHVSRNATCPFCRWPDTLAHSFYSCRIVKLLWLIVERWMSNVVGCNFQITEDFIVYLIFQKLADPMYDSLLLIVSAELKYAIWGQRNIVKYEKKQSSTADIQRLFLYCVKSRIEADFFRLQPDDFARLWCRGRPALATVAGQHLTVDLKPP